jgi:heat shock protein HslJ
MRLTTIVLAAALIAAPAFAQEAAPPSDTIKEVTAKGVIFDVMGMEIDLEFKADGNFTGMAGQLAGTWKADGKKLCLTIPGMIENQCTEYPDGKKSGDSFEIVTDMGALNVKIR